MFGDVRNLQKSLQILSKCEKNEIFLIIWYHDVKTTKQPVLGKVASKSNALQYCVTRYKINNYISFVQSNVLPYNFALLFKSKLALLVSF